MVRHIVALVAALVLNATANLLIKASAMGPAGGGVLAGGPAGVIKAIATNWLFVVGLICFGLNLVAYQYALQKLQISIAYPIMVTCGYVIIVLVASTSTRMHERLVPMQWAGVVLILVGVILVSAYVKTDQPLEGAAERAGAAPGAK
jgi:small multidrug resistance pump